MNMSLKINEIFKMALNAAYLNAEVIHGGDSHLTNSLTWPMVRLDSTRPEAWLDSTQHNAGSLRGSRSTVISIVIHTRGIFEVQFITIVCRPQVLLIQCASSGHPPQAALICM